MAYFHEPSFDTCVRPLMGPASDEFIHYGMHFTSMFMRCYPDRVTTRRILDENRLTTLAWLKHASVAASAPERVRRRAVA